MTILWAGGEIGSVIPSDANVVEVTTNGSGLSFVDSFKRCAIQSYGGSSYFETPSVGSQTTIWYHFEFSSVWGQSSSSQHVWATFLDSGGTERFRLKGSAYGETLRLEYNLSGTWTLLGSEISIATHQFTGTMQVFDLGLVVNSASGSAKLYSSGTLRIDSGTVDFSSITAMDEMRGYGRTTLIPEKNFFSQLIIADDATIGKRLVTVYPSGAGATTGFTSGDYTGVDETVYSDADYISSGTADQVELFAGTAAGSLTGYAVQAVIVAARAKYSSGSPNDIQLALRSGGTNYFSATQALDVGYGAHVAVWSTNPDGSIAWTNTTAAATQFGVKSIA